MTRALYNAHGEPVPPRPDTTSYKVYEAAIKAVLDQQRQATLDKVKSDLSLTDEKMIQALADCYRTGIDGFDYALRLHTLGWPMNMDLANNLTYFLALVGMRLQNMESKWFMEHKPVAPTGVRLDARIAIDDGTEPAARILMDRELAGRNERGVIHIEMLEDGTWKSLPIERIGKIWPPENN